MGYVFQAVPPDLLNAEPPRMLASQPDERREKRLVGLFLATLMAVPGFRRMVLAAVGVKAGAAHAQVYQDVRFKGDAAVGGDLRPPDGLLRLHGARGASVLFDIAFGAFDAHDIDEVRRIADHLAMAQERRIARVVTISSTIPDQRFAQAARSQIELTGPDRLRALTWMETVDFALHLLERKATGGAQGRFLLEQYVRAMKDEVVRETQARASRGQGALYFTSLGGDWDGFLADVAKNGAVDPKDPRLNAIATNWLALLRSMALYLTRSAQRDEDILMFPNVRPTNPRARKDQILKRLRAGGQLLATFHKRGERVPIIMCVDVAHKEALFQLQLDGPTEKHGPNVIPNLARAIGEDMTLGKTRIKIYWPSEKQPRTVTRQQAMKEPIAAAPPQHGMLPDRFVIERAVPCENIIGEPDSLVQLLTLELRGFRASMRHILLPDMAA